MKIEKIRRIILEKHPTKNIVDDHVNGSLTVIWRDWDKILKNKPKMVYVSSVNTGEIKGPHLHKKRNSYFICIHGCVSFIIKDENGKYIEFEVSADKPELIIVPKGIASAHVNWSSSTSRILVLADVAWKPNDNEMVNTEFLDYNWKKRSLKE